MLPNWIQKRSSSSSILVQELDLRSDMDKWFCFSGGKKKGGGKKEEDTVGRLNSEMKKWEVKEILVGVGKVNE